MIVKLISKVQNIKDLLYFVLSTALYINYFT